MRKSGRSIFALLDILFIQSVVELLEKTVTAEIVGLSPLWAQTNIIKDVLTESLGTFMSMKCRWSQKRSTLQIPAGFQLSPTLTWTSYCLLDRNSYSCFSWFLLLCYCHSPRPPSQNRLELSRQDEQELADFTDILQRHTCGHILLDLKTAFFHTTEIQEMF